MHVIDYGHMRDVVLNQGTLSDLGKEDGARLGCGNEPRPLSFSGTETWQRRIAGRLGLEHTLRPPGRPRKGDSSEAGGG